MDSGSSRTLAASLKLIRLLLKFAAAFSGSHSKSTARVYGSPAVDGQAAERRGERRAKHVRSTAKLGGLKLDRPTKKRALDTSWELNGRKPFGRVEVVLTALVNDSNVAVPSRVGVG